MAGNAAMRIGAHEIAAWKEAFGRGDVQACVAIGERLVQTVPSDGRAWHLLGLALTFAGDPRRGADTLRKATRLARADATVWDAFGVALQRCGDPRAAADAFRTSLRLAPGVASVWSNAACNAFEMGDAAEALRLAERALGLDAALPEAHLARGNALSAQGRLGDALAACNEALRLRPGFPGALLSAGVVLEKLGRLGEAVAATRAAVERAPGLVPAHINLGSLYCALGDNARAAEHSRRAIEADPDAATAWSNLLYALAHDERVSPQQAFEAHAAFGAHFAAKHAPREHIAAQRDGERRLRIGFVSADLRDHPVARFVEPVFRELDRWRFSPIVYMNVAADDPVATRLRGLVDAWHEVGGLSDVQLCERIVRDRIDVLFDLSGHTAGNRLPVFAMKPAPVQISWIGYPGTTGLRTIDYRLVDATTAPPGELDHLFTERLAYLPYQSTFERPERLPDVAPAPVLRNGYLTFGSFNRAAKLGARTIALWASVLRAVPTSLLLVAGVPDDDTERRLCERLEAEGVDRVRLEFRRRVAIDEYLQLHGEVDVALDTVPFSSGTTANFALWMGVPALTLAGGSMAQRLCASRLAAAGLHDFITGSDEEFVATARRWAGDPQAVAGLRAGLRARLEEAFARQPAELTRALEDTLQRMSAEHCARAAGAAAAG